MASSSCSSGQLTKNGSEENSEHKIKSQGINTQNEQITY